MASSVQGDPRWNSYRPHDDGDSHTDAATNIKRRSTSLQRKNSDFYSGNSRRDPPNESRQRRWDEGREDVENRDSESRGYSGTGSRRKSFSSVGNVLDGSQPPSASRRSIEDASNNRVRSTLVSGLASGVSSPKSPKSIDHMPRISGAELAVTNQHIPVKRPAQTEYTGDPRKRLATSGRSGPSRASTASPIVASSDDTRSALTPSNKSPSEIHKSTQSAESDVPANAPQLNQVDMIASVIIDVVEKSIATASLRRKVEECQNAAEKAALVDEKNRKNFKDHIPLIEQGQETKRRAQQRAASVMENFEASIGPRRESALKAANEILSLVVAPSGNPIYQDKKLEDFGETLLQARETGLAAQTAAQQAQNTTEALIRRLNESIKSHDQDIQTSKNINTRLMGLEQRQKQERADEAALAKRLDILEQRKPPERLVTLAAFEQLSKLTESLIKNHEELESKCETQRKELAELKRKPATPSAGLVTDELQKIDERFQSAAVEIAAVQNTIKHLDACITSMPTKADIAEMSSSTATKALKVAQAHFLELKTREKGTEEPNSRPNPIFDLFVNTTTHNMKQIHSEIASVIKTQKTDHESVANSIQRAQSAVNELQVQLDASSISSKARDEVVTEQVESLVNRLNDVENEAETLSQNLERHVSETKAAIHQMMEHFDGKVGPLFAQRADTSRPTDRPIQRNPQLANELSALNLRLSDLDTELKSVQAIGHSNDHSIRSLNSRINNVTTEHVTRAMVHQLNTMYPYAATAQAEFVKVREDRLAFQDLRKDHNSTSLQTQKNTAAITTQEQKLNELQKAGRESDTKLSSILEQFKEGKDALQSRIDEHVRKYDASMEQQKQLSATITKVCADLDNSMTSQGARVVELSKKVNKVETAFTNFESKSKAVGDKNATTSGTEKSMKSAARKPLETTTPPAEENAAIPTPRSAQAISGKAARAGSSTATVSMSNESVEPEYLRDWQPHPQPSNAVRKGHNSRRSESFGAATINNRAPDPLQSPRVSVMSNGTKRKRDLEHIPPDVDKLIDRSDDEDYIDKSDDEDYIDSDVFESKPKVKSSRRQKIARKG